MTIEEIRKKISCKEYIISEHAEKEKQEEKIELSDIKKAICKGKVIEYYPNDPRGPSCLILGYSRKKPIHIVCGWTKYNWLIIITVYIPSPPKRITPLERGKRRK